MSKTLLVVDDAMIIREKIKEIASAAGWMILGEAVNGHDAVVQYFELQPDAVTLDLVMPEYDGMYAIRNIMELDPVARILVVSALEQKNVLKEAFKLGAFDFVVKPFGDRALSAALEKMVPQNTMEQTGP